MNDPLHKPSLLTCIFICCLILNYFSSVGDGVILPLPTSIGQSFEFDLQITVPYSIILPAFIGRRRRKRSKHNSKNGEPEDYASYYNKMTSNLDMDSREGVIFAKLSSLMSWMGLDNIECQKRLLCLISQNPAKYSPISDIVFQHLDPRRDKLHHLNKNMYTNHMQSAQEGHNWQYYAFYDAERKGFYPGTNCTHETITCRVNPDNVINWDMMSVFKAVKSFINLQFK